MKDKYFSVENLCMADTDNRPPRSTYLPLKFCLSFFFSLSLGKYVCIGWWHFNWGDSRSTCSRHDRAT